MTWIACFPWLTKEYEISEFSKDKTFYDASLELNWLAKIC